MSLLSLYAENEERRLELANLIAQGMSALYPRCSTLDVAIELRKQGASCLGPILDLFVSRIRGHTPDGTRVITDVNVAFSPPGGGFAPEFLMARTGGTLGTTAAQIRLNVGLDGPDGEGVGIETFVYDLLCVMTQSVQWATLAPASLLLAMTMSRQAKLTHRGKRLLLLRKVRSGYKQTHHWLCLPVGNINPFGKTGETSGQ